MRGNAPTIHSLMRVVMKPNNLASGDVVLSSLSIGWPINSQVGPHRATTRLLETFRTQL
jgi:hypothetical protein